MAGINVEKCCTEELTRGSGKLSKRFRFGVAALRGHFTAVLYNSRGEEVAELYDGEIESGEKLVHCSTAGVAAGVYVVRGTAGGIVTAKLVMILR
ncbi:MAG: hypothetical protein ABIR47_06025 [Candidatus Kapaibacterium sp.]